jgi:hypothetical protein
VKLLYAFAFALFPLAATAQPLSPSPLSEWCNDDHCDDADRGGTISADNILTIWATFERNSAVVSTDMDDILVSGLLSNPDDDITVGSVRPRDESSIEQPVFRNDELGAEPELQEDATIASRAVTLETPLGQSCEDFDQIATTGLSAARMPTLATGPIDESAAGE